MSHPTAPPAPFEALRQYAAEAVDQLVVELQEKQVGYHVPAGDALALLKAVAKVREESAWQVWEAWAIRHAIPVHCIVADMGAGDGGRERLEPTTDERRVLQARLRDLLGYCVLGLVLAEDLSQ